LFKRVCTGRQEDIIGKSTVQNEQEVAALEPISEGAVSGTAEEAGGPDGNAAPETEREYILRSNSK